MEKYGIQLEPRGLFGEGRKDFFNNPVLTEVGKKYEIRRHRLLCVF